MLTGVGSWVHPLHGPFVFSQDLHHRVYAFDALPNVIGWIQAEDRSVFDEGATALDAIFAGLEPSSAT